MSNYKALFVSDIHLSAKPPALRSLEPDWYEAMARPIREMRRLAEKLDVPIVCGGDVFDHWNPPAELITFAIQELPKMYAVPGQHDLSNHSYEDIERTGYWTLVEAGVIHHLEPSSPYRVRDLELYGFPWGFPITPCERFDNDYTRIAVIHAYCWEGQHKYMHAPDSGNVKNFKLSGYDVAVFGDNHINWVVGRVINCGGFMRRHKPDLDREPMIGLLTKSGKIEKHLLNTSDDIYSPPEEDDIVETGAIEIGNFTDSLLGLKDSKDLDFLQLIRRWCKKNKIPGRVLSLIEESIEREKA